MLDKEQLRKWFTPEQIQKIDKTLSSVDWADKVQTRSDYQAIIDNCYYDSKRGERFEKFCSQYIVQVTGRYNGLPLELFPYQKEVFRRLMGWLRPDGTRRFRTLYFSVPKKSGKTTITSALALYCLTVDGESNAQCFICANDRAQASICFNSAANYVKKSPKLREELKVIPSTKRIVYPANFSFLQALSREVSVQDGLDAHLVVMDELKDAINSDMYDTLRFAGAARTQPLFIVISTSGTDLSTVLGREYQLAQKVLSGEICDTSYLAAIWEATNDDDPSDPAVWRKANPSLSYTISEEDIRVDYQHAVEQGSLGNFKRRRLNMWAKDSSFWMPREKWDACGTQNFPDLTDLMQYQCWLGLDLADSNDVNALVAVWRESNSLFYIKPWFWVPAETVITRSRETSIPYSQWVSEGWLLETEGATTDYEQIFEMIIDLSSQLQLNAICYDPWQALSFMNRLEILGIQTIKIPQMISHLSEPTKALGRMIRNREIVHDSNPVLSWMISNVVTASDRNNNIRPDRKKSKEKIDGVAALVTALARVIVSEDVALYGGTGLVVL